MNVLLAVFLALGLTLALELPLAALLAPSGSRGVCVATALYANLVTHPLAVALHPELGFLPVELGVIGVECALYARVAGLAPVRALLIGALANLASACLPL